VNVLAAYAPHADEELLLVTRSTHQIQHEQTAEKSTSILDVTSCGWRP
jgi:hypothetical protein